MFLKKSLYDLCVFLDGCGSRMFNCEVLFMEDESRFSVLPQFQLYKGPRSYKRRSGGVESFLLYEDGRHLPVSYNIEFKRTPLFSFVGASAVVLITPNEFSKELGVQKNGARTIWGGEPVVGDYSPPLFCPEERVREYKKRPLRLLFGSSHNAGNVGLPTRTVLHAFDVLEFFLDGDTLQFCVYGSQQDISEFLRDSLNVAHYKGSYV